jgi:hypothetical protein
MWPGGKLITTWYLTTGIIGLVISARGVGEGLLGIGWGEEQGKEKEREGGSGSRVCGHLNI